MKIAVIGVTGLVGSVICRVLTERKFPISTFLPVASARSVGKTIEFQGKSYTILSPQQAIDACPDIAIFSAGASTARTWAPLFAAVGTYVIDNSSAFRMDEDKPLIVPEINAQTILPHHHIIPNPNCSTIQMVMALAPLHRVYGIDRIVVSTYQSVTGTGAKAVQQYEQEARGEQAGQPAYPHPIFQNCLPHCDIFLDNDYTREEMKLVHETRKILGDMRLRITATAVRVPVVGGHSEAVNVAFHRDFELSAVRELLAQTPGVLVVDDVSQHQYPMPRMAQHCDEVFVGRLRRDDSNANSLNMWIVADNLRKGAATNAIQIAEFLLEHPQIYTMNSRNASQTVLIDGSPANVRLV